MRSRSATLAALAAVVLALTGQGPADQSARLTLETPCAPAGYERLLHRYLTIVPLADGGYESRFDYAAFRADPGQAKIRDELRARFLGVDPATLDLPSRRAWALNAYNFLILDVIIGHLVGPGGDTLRSISDLGTKPRGVFEDSIYTVGEERFSLDSFERRFVFGQGIAGPGGRAENLDPRFHFALVCGAKGCPPLGEHAYDPARLDSQLDDAVRNALLSPRQLRLEGGTAHVSKIFEWYAADFDPEGIPAFLVRFARPEIAARLGAKKAAPDIVPDIDWDWSLNRP